MTAREKARELINNMGDAGNDDWKCEQHFKAIERALLDTIEEFRTECMCLHAKLMGRLDLKGDQQFLSGEISALNKYAAEIRKMKGE